jgi:tetratricopeptide (TPR) repeat protein
VSYGDYKQALEYYQKSLAIQIKLFGENNDDVADSYNHIGICYNNLGYYEKSLENYKKSLAYAIKRFG